jgi:hypothetical protein
MILEKRDAFPNGLISKDKVKLAGTNVVSYTASLESVPMKPLADLPDKDEIGFISMDPILANAGVDHGLGTKREASPELISAETITLESRELFK